MNYQENGTTIWKTPEEADAGLRQSALSEIRRRMVEIFWRSRAMHQPLLGQHAQHFVQIVPSE